MVHKCRILFYNTILNMHTQTAISALRHFAHEHDDLPAFHAGYLVLTVVTAAMLNLGFFVLLIAAHMALDLVKYRELHHLSWARTAEGTLRESLLDCALLAGALACTVYLHHTIGIVAVSGVVRADLTLVRLAGTLLPKISIMERFAAMLLHMGTHLRTVVARLGEALSPGEKLELFLLLAFLVLLLSAPLVLHISTAEYMRHLAVELIPWRI